MEGEFRIIYRMPNSKSARTILLPDKDSTIAFIADHGWSVIRDITCNGESITVKQMLKLLRLAAELVG